MRISRYREAVDKSEGWCKTCKRFTRLQTEPDARNYECPKCGENTVYGAEEALMEGFFNV